MAERTYPERIGKYRVTGLLGRGGMGDVLKALQEPLNRVVALKVLSEGHAGSEEFQERFFMEAKAVSLLEHQNIVGIYDFGSEAGFRYIAMRCIEGESLADRLRREKKLDPKTAVDFAKKICRALKYAHERRILHRDIKPQNILLGEKENLFVTDFGIARLFHETGVTRTGVVVGTPEYMSPEQAEGLELNGQTDLYSLGVVLYEMMTGSPPFTGETPLAIAYQHVNIQPAPPSKARPEISKRLELMVLKSLKKDRASRYKTADEFLADLDTAFETPLEKDKTRDMKAVDTVVREKLFTNDQRVVDRRSSDRRREGRRSYMRREDGTYSPWGRFVWAALGLALAAGAFLYWPRVRPAPPAAAVKLASLVFTGAGHPESAFDGDAGTAWQGAEGAGFTVAFHPPRAASRVEVAAGAGGRPRRMLFVFNGEKEFEVELKDDGGRQPFWLPETLLLSDVKVSIRSIYPGPASAEASVAEMKFWNTPDR